MKGASEEILREIVKEGNTDEESNRVREDEEKER